MSLVERSLTLSDSTCFHCWIFKTLDATGKDVFWLKAYDIASFLKYKRPNNAILKLVDPDWKTTWEELKTHLSEQNRHLQMSFKPQTIFISEPGFYALVTRSKLDEAKRFTAWVFKEVLPGLRETGQFSVQLSIKEQRITELTDGLIKANQALSIASEHLAKAREDAVNLSCRLADIAEDVIAKPQSKELLHTLTVHHLNGDYTKQLAFTRCQQRSLSNSLKRLSNKNPRAVELYRNTYVPNGINVLNCFKEYLKRFKVDYKAKNNVVSLMDDLNSQQIIGIIQRVMQQTLTNNEKLP